MKDKIFEKESIEIIEALKDAFEIKIETLGDSIEVIVINNDDIAADVFLNQEEGVFSLSDYAKDKLANLKERVALAKKAAATLKELIL